jgi:hypothetical protein
VTAGDTNRLDDALASPQGCPVCGSEAIRGANHAPPNLYSEKLAGMLGVYETSLIEAVPNVQCGECGVWYKPRWFRSEVLAALFERGVPTHPKGWDAGSPRFSRRGFLTECDAYRRAIEYNDATEIARHRRGLVSIVESIATIAGSSLLGDLVDAIRAGDAALLMTTAMDLPEDLGEPAAFRRFSGFSATALWDWMEDHIGPVERYAEVGCPLWGQLARAGHSAVACTHLARTEANYWGAGCRSDGRHCREELVRRGPVARLDWAARQAGHFDAIGAFQYLDHLEDPVGFVAECFDAAPALLLILDGVDEPTAIQHRTGWNDRAIDWLARRFDKRVFSDFDAIRPSGNRVWLLAGD